MDDKRHIVLIHGIGNQRAGFSDLVWHRLCKRGVEFPTARWHEVIWQPTVEHVAASVFRTRQRLLFSAFRWASINLVGDAILYGRERMARLIRAELIRVLRRLPRDSEIIFVAHSLGTVILSDALHNLHHGLDNGFHGGFATRRIITMGSPLKLYNAGRFGIPENGTLNSYVPPHTQAGWFNLFCPWDPIYLLGGPLADWIPGVTDVAVNNWLHPHTGYWRRRELLDLIVEAL